MSKIWYGGGSVPNGTGEPITDVGDQWMPIGGSVRMGASDSGHDTAPVIIVRVTGTISRIYTHVRSNSWASGGSWQLRLRNHNGGSPTYEATTITVNDGSTGAFSDLTSAFTITAGQEYSWEWTRTGGGSGDMRIPFLSYSFEPSSGDAFQWNTFERPNLASASATRHCPPVGDNSGSTELNSSRQKIRVAGNLTHFGVRVFTNGRSTNTTWQLLLNGTPIGSGVTFAGGATGFSEDAGFGTPQALAVDDYLSVRITTGTGTGTIEWTCTPVTIDPTAAEFQGAVSSGAGLIVNQGVTTYIPIIGECERTTTTDGNAKIKVPFAIRLDRFRAYIRSNSLGGGQTFTLNIRLNGSTQRSIQWSSGSGAAEAAASDSNPFDTAEGDELDVQCVATAGSGSAQLMNLTFRGMEIVATSVVRQMMQHHGG